MADLYVLHLFRNPEIFDVFSVPNKDFVFPDAVITVEDFVKAPCKRSRKRNFKLLLVIEFIAILYVLHLFWIYGVFDVFSVQYNIG